ncbi:hypothetical protein BDB01DRAFT_790233 [Pilobolus umbonatus]|nr:hypothetical protein BDB01DRAFT_790233 [Pilobolus umbonatus]
MNIHWLLLSVFILSIHAQNFKYGPSLPKNKLYGLDTDTIGLGAMDGTIAAFGDFNGDKFTDLFILSSDQTTVSVYLWNHQAFTFRPSPNTKLIQPGFIITNVVPGDYNYDGHLDILVMGEENPENGGEIRMHIYCGDGNDTFQVDPIKLPSAIQSLPIVLDINGDMRTDILGYSKDTNELSVWMNTGGSSLFNLTSASTVFNKVDTCQWAHPHSNAFVDLNGDCLSDLVFVCSDGHKQSIQIWVNNKQEGFILSQEAELPPGAGALSFADIDGDGAIDIVFPVCVDSKCSIHIVYNQQIGLCSKSQESQDGTVCRRARDLCVADRDFRFDFKKPSTKNYVIYDIHTQLREKETLRMMDDSFRGKLPVGLHIGDYNMDGYPDILLTTTERVILLQSIMCHSDACASAAMEAEKRTFTMVTTGADILSELPNPTQAVFFDIDEDGSLDMIVLQKNKKSNAGRTASFVVNNYFNDAFFLKGLVSNGVSNHDGYGVSYPGATLKFTVLDMAGTKRSHQVSQLSQSAYLPLLTPYCLFGLGRTNNYVEEMFAGVSRHQDKNYYFYEGVIPNSQLVILPYQPENVQDSSSWKVELYIKPADYVPWVLVALVAAAVVLAIIVAALRMMEKREDEMERRKALHIINFDAL